MYNLQSGSSKAQIECYKADMEAEKEKREKNNSIINAVKRLERAGGENSRVNQKLEEIKIQFFCPKCSERFSEQNQFNNCVSDPQDYEEYDHCFNCGYDSREEKEKEEVPF